MLEMAIINIVLKNPKPYQADHLKYLREKWEDNGL